MSEWVERPLAELAAIRISNVDKKSLPNEQAVRLCNYMDVYAGTYLDDDVEYMEATATVREIGNFALQAGDVVITKDSESPDDIGIPALIETTSGGLVCGYHLAILRPDRKKVDPLFLLKQIETDLVRRFYSKRAAGSTRYALATGTIAATPIKVPPIEDQAIIARILRALDTQIEATEGLIAKQERVRAGLMQDLFTRGVDEHGRLRPPRHQAPHLYHQTELGWLPVGWEVIQLQNVADVQRGRFGARPRNDPRFYGGEFPFIQTGDVSNASGRRILAHSQTLNRLGLATSRMFPAGAIAVTIAANIGDAAMLSYPMCAPDSVVGVVPFQMTDSYFLQLAIGSKKVWLERRAPQTAQKNINLEDLRPLKIEYPGSEERLEIAKIVAKATSSVEKLEIELGKLRLKKTGLMQDLLTGKVSVGPLLESLPA